MQKNQKYKPMNGKIQDYFGFKMDSYGKISDTTVAICFHCHKQFKYHGSTTSLSYHRNNKHQLYLQDKKISATNIADYAITRPAIKNLQDFYNAANIKLAKWIAKSGRLLNIVEDKNFKGILLFFLAKIKIIIFQLVIL